MKNEGKIDDEQAKIIFANLKNGGEFMDFKNVKLNRIILFSILICICLASCSFETIESNFATYEEALNKNYFEKGDTQRTCKQKNEENICKK
ncbi:MAG: hypothetical protein IPH94_01470 [Saprospiraceae bacterium]|nr:hypothetical protein [Saprospiraceae bacterium]